MYVPIMVYDICIHTPDCMGISWLCNGNSFAMHREEIAKAYASSVGACNVCKKCAHKFYKKRNERKEGNPPQKSETEAIYKASEQKKKKVAI